MLALGNILDSCVVHIAGPCSNDLCSTPRWMVEVVVQTRCRIPPWCSTISSKEASMTTIVAGVGDYAHFL
jgi:hypothetical protein